MNRWACALMCLTAVPLFDVGASRAVSVEVEVTRSGTVEGSSPLPVRVRFESAAPSEGSEGSVSPVELLLDTGSATVDLPPGTLWHVVADCKGHWSPPAVLAVDAGGGSVSLQLLPTGRLEGEIRQLPGPAQVQQVGLRFESAPDESGSSSTELTRHEVQCPVTDDRFACEVPAGTLDLRLRARGFISRYFWSVELLPARSLKLGTIELQPGASVVGWVEIPARDFDLSATAVTLTPMETTLARASSELLRRDALRFTETINARGFFSFEGVAPGGYRLEVRHPNYATAVFVPLDVFEAAETEVHSIRLSEPAALDVIVQPAQHPFRRPWLLRLQRESEVPGNFDLAAEGPSMSGTFHAKGLDPGKFLVEVLGPKGSRWAQEELVVGPGGNELRIELPFVRIEGSVRFKDEALAGADVWFGGRRGRQRISYVTDDEGKFYAFLPRKKSWLVDVVSRDPKIETRFTDVAPETHPGKPWLQILLEIPDTRLEGRVRRVDEGPVQGAIVRALPGQGVEGDLTSLIVGEEGTFELQGLTPGQWWLQAQLSEKGRTAWTGGNRSVNIPKGEPPPSIELLLREVWTVEGQVFSTSGVPVPGAEIHARPVYPVPGVVPDFLPHTVVGASGEFELDLPAGSVQAILTVLPPGFTARQIIIEAHRDGPVMIEVDTIGGTLVLEGFPDRQLDPDTPPPRLFAGHSMDVSALAPWAVAFGGGFDSDTRRLVLPRIEPGMYTLCVGNHAPLDLLHPPEGKAAPCVQGNLSPFGELTLQVPEAP